VSPSAPSVVPGSLVRTLLGSVAEGIMVCGRDRRCLLWNRFLEELTGLSEAEVRGRDVLEPFPFLRRRGVERLLQRALGGETVRFPDTPYRVPGTGRSGWVAGQFSPYRDARGEVVGVVAVLHEITERKRTEQSLRESEERLRAIFEGAPAGISIVDREGRMAAANPALASMLGRAGSEMEGVRVAALVHPAERAEHARVFRELAEGSRAAWRGERRFVRPDGSEVWGRVTASPLPGDGGEPWRAVAMIEDVTERRRVAETNVRLAAFVRETPNPVLECGADGEIVFRNPAADAAAAEMAGGELAALLPAAHRQLARAALEGGQVFRGVEVTVGERILAWTYHPNLPLGAVHLFGEEITGRRAVEEQLRHEALHDALTGLPNRLLFLEHLARALLRQRRTPEHQFAVLFLDLDRFKVVNDGLGHHVGDELLVAVAGRLLGCVRGTDTVARFGGDEFAVLLDGIPDLEFVLGAAERIQETVSAPVALSGYEVYTSASIGVALSGAAYGRPEYLLRNADMAMYRAKAAGMGRTEVFDRAMHARALLRLQTETDLRHALERGEFRVFFQPVVGLGDGGVAGVEALVRWKHPERGWVGPGEFIAAAEETGLISALGRWVLGEACRCVRAWDAAGCPPVWASVNLSVKQFVQPDLAAQVAAALDASGLAPDRLRLEVTESVVADDLEAAAATLRRLRALGPRVYMDDFGTGYSSLSYLHRLPLDGLKVDRSFVSRIGTEESAAALVRTIAALGSSLGLAVVGEGVETPAQLAALRALEFDFAQGFHLCPPLDADALGVLLAHDPRW
jgi:diguanylate cyclase (GGDEF)-like protein/PAS domain S-box-containing protein